MNGNYILHMNIVSYHDTYSAYKIITILLMRTGLSQLLMVSLMVWLATDPFVFVLLLLLNIEHSAAGNYDGLAASEEKLMEEGRVMSRVQ